MFTRFRETRNETKIKLYERVVEESSYRLPRIDHVFCIFFFSPLINFVISIHEHEMSFYIVLEVGLNGIGNPCLVTVVEIREIYRY